MNKDEIKKFAKASALAKLLFKQIKLLQIKEQRLAIQGKKAWDAKRVIFAQAYWAQAQKCAEEIQQLRLQVADCSNQIDKIYKALEDQNANGNSRNRDLNQSAP